MFSGCGAIRLLPLKLGQDGLPKVPSLAKYARLRALISKELRSLAGQLL